MTLTYKQQDTFQTSCGGVAAIVTLIIFAAWVALEFIYVFEPDGAFGTNTSTGETQDENNHFPIYEIE